MAMVRLSLLGTRSAHRRGRLRRLFELRKEPPGFLLGCSSTGQFQGGASFVEVTNGRLDRSQAYCFKYLVDRRWVRPRGSAMAAWGQPVEISSVNLLRRWAIASFWEQRNVHEITHFR